MSLRKIALTTTILSLTSINATSWVGGAVSSPQKDASVNSFFAANVVERKQKVLAEGKKAFQEVLADQLPKETVKEGGTEYAPEDLLKKLDSHIRQDIEQNFLKGYDFDGDIKAAQIKKGLMEAKSGSLLNTLRSFKGKKVEEAAKFIDDANAKDTLDSLKVFVDKGEMQELESPLVKLLLSDALGREKLKLLKVTSAEDSGFSSLSGKGGGVEQLEKETEAEEAARLEREQQNLLQEKTETINALITDAGGEEKVADYIKLVKFYSGGEEEVSLANIIKQLNKYMQNFNFTNKQVKAAKSINENYSPRDKMDESELYGSGWSIKAWLDAKKDDQLKDDAIEHSLLTLYQIYQKLNSLENSSLFTADGTQWELLDSESTTSINNILKTKFPTVGEDAQIAQMEAAVRGIQSIFADLGNKDIRSELESQFGKLYIEGDKLDKSQVLIKDYGPEGPNIKQLHGLAEGLSLEKIDPQKVEQVKKALENWGKFFGDSPYKDLDRQVERIKEEDPGLYDFAISSEYSPQKAFFFNPLKHLRVGESFFFVQGEKERKGISSNTKPPEIKQLWDEKWEEARSTRRGFAKSLAKSIYLNLITYSATAKKLEKQGDFLHINKMIDIPEFFFTLKDGQVLSHEHVCLIYVYNLLMNTYNLWKDSDLNAFLPIYLSASIWAEAFKNSEGIKGWGNSRKKKLSQASFPWQFTTKS